MNTATQTPKTAKRKRRTRSSTRPTPDKEPPAAAVTADSLESMEEHLLGLGEDKLALAECLATIKRLCKEKSEIIDAHNKLAKMMNEKSFRHCAGFPECPDCDACLFCTKEMWHILDMWENCDESRCDDCCEKRRKKKKQKQ